jgi:hypothetical protein
LSDINGSECFFFLNQVDRPLCFEEFSLFVGLIVSGMLASLGEVGLFIGDDNESKE